MPRKLDESVVDAVREYIAGYWKHRGVSPAQSEIRKRFGLTEPRAHRVVHALAERGFIELTDRNKIAVPELYVASTRRLVPIVTTVACGEPAFASENYEQMVELPDYFTGAGDFFIVVARGESMVGAGIVGGDHLVIRQQPDAENGQIVVATTPSGYGSEEVDWTLKRLVKENGKNRWLRPENDNRDMYRDLDAREYAVVGKLVGIYRQFG
ncbi:MAG: hypothetical protein FWB72_05235 [Firmicutes bacterium]|nr:hypothetical protein [Bacillota bacterium]